MSVSGIVKIFSRVLETEDINEDSDFFMSGGDSLLATRVLSAIAREYRTELTLTDFLAGSSPKALYEQIGKAIA
jgi:acyl carrier protein